MKIKVVVLRPGATKLSLSTPNKKEQYDLEVKPESTVRFIAGKVSQLTKLDISRLSFSIDGKPMGDLQQIKRFNIKHGSVITCTVRIKEGDRGIKRN